jgi:hypothetical protein
MVNFEKDRGYQSNNIPDFEANYSFLKNQTPRFFLPGKFEDTFNSIIFYWRDDASDTKEKLEKFESALTHPSVPDLERNDISEIIAPVRKLHQEFVGSVRLISQGAKFKWDKMEELGEKAGSLRKRNYREEDQALALLDAINKTYRKPLSKKEVALMRQKLAQHALDELPTVGQHRALSWTAAEIGEHVESRTTQDDILLEEDELVHALGSASWMPEEITKAKRTYDDLKKVIRNRNNSVSVKLLIPLKDLWNYANGKKVSNVSAINVLQLAEKIYRGLEAGGAFNVNIGKD